MYVLPSFLTTCFGLNQPSSGVISYAKTVRLYCEIFIFGVLSTNHTVVPCPPQDKGNTNTLKERTRTAWASVTKTTRQWEGNVTTIAGSNNINKKDTYIIWTNG
jgi:hypothetical protein